MLRTTQVLTDLCQGVYLKCVFKVIPKCQSTRFHTAKFIVMLIAIIIIIIIVVIILFIVVIIIIIIVWLWNIPPLAEVV